MKHFLYHTLIILLLSVSVAGLCTESWMTSSTQSTEESIPKTVDETVILRNEQQNTKGSGRVVLRGYTLGSSNHDQFYLAVLPSPQQALFLRFRSLLL